MVIHAILLETVGFHFLLHQWKEWVSWIVLAFNAYTVILLLANIQAVRLSPIRFSDKSIIFLVGLFGLLEIPVSAIKTFTPYKPEIVYTKTEKKKIFEAYVHDFIAERPQFEILLDQDFKPYTVFGISRKVNKIHVRVDNPQDFALGIKPRIS